MYRKVMLALLMVLLAVIAVELAHPRTAPSQLPEPKPSTASLDLLDRKIPELILRNSTLEQAVRELQSKSDVPIVVDWSALNGWKNLPIDIDFHDITVGDAVAFLFNCRRLYVPTADYPDFGIAHGKLVVTTVFRLPTSAFTLRTYDVRDLLTDEYWGCPTGMQTQKLQDDRRDSLCNLLTTWSGIHDWRDTAAFRGGSDGHERFGLGSQDDWAGRLFICQTAYNQRRIDSVIRELRNGRTGLIARAPMERRITHLDFHSTPLRNAIHAIAENAHASIAFESNEVDDPKLDLAAPITVTLDDVSVDAALSAIKQLSAFNFDEYESGVIVVNGGRNEDTIIEAIDASALAKEVGQPLTASSPYAFYHASGDPDETAAGTPVIKVILNFLNRGDEMSLEFYGTHAVVCGSARGRKRARQVIDCLSHPVSLLETQSPAIAGEPARRLARFQFNGIDSVVAFLKWRAAAGPSNVVMREQPPVISYDEKISIDLHDVTLEDALTPIIRGPSVQNAFPNLSIEDGIIYMDGNGGGILRAYDLTPLLKSVRWYHEDDPNADPSSLDERKAEALKRCLVRDVENAMWDLENSQPNAVYWHGRLLVMTTPGGHRQIFEYLRNILTSGRLPEKKPAE